MVNRKKNGPNLIAFFILFCLILAILNSDSNPFKVMANYEKETIRDMCRLPECEYFESDGNPVFFDTNCYSEQIGILFACSGTSWVSLHTHSIYMYLCGVEPIELSPEIKSHCDVFKFNVSNLLEDKEGWVLG